ncbi:Zn-dependent alcohol dehydrogenase [Siminovitchia sediminis]|uniref:Zn-dependent alcohol dehydrogenase n=1 Tax=Siminovitchia sediminis TaxID=1274353 RepID=A0ABW4KG37_9BACI
MKAAVFYGPGIPLTVEDVDIQGPGPDEVLVKIHYSGVCHSDYRVLTGDWEYPKPMILGHEGAGTIEQVGENVKGLKVGDHVILSWIPSCKKCFHCISGRPHLCESYETKTETRRSLHGKPVYPEFRVGSFAEYAIVPESGAIKIRDDMPLDKACLIGCSVMTGVGSVINTAKVEPGSSVLVVGCGGVGLSIVQGAALTSASKIIAADLNEEKLKKAVEFGATHTIHSGKNDLIEEVMRMTDGVGVDYSFEAIGNVKTIEIAYEAIRTGGTAVIVGQAASGQKISIDPFEMSDREKKLIGCNYGSAKPDIDFPKLIDLYMMKKLDVDSMISHVVGLEELNEAFERMKKGKGLRTIVKIG